MPFSLAVILLLLSTPLQGQTTLLVPASKRALPVQADDAGDYAKAIGDHYRQARGIFGLSRSNAAQAVGWYTNAFEKGSAAAALALYQMYAQGEGVGQDRDVATLWLERATRLGTARKDGAMRRLDDALGHLKAPLPLVSAGVSEDRPGGTPLAPMSFDGQIATLCNQIGLELEAANKPSIAVVAFANLDGRTSELGKYVAEELTTALYRTKRYKVIERQLLNRVLRELKLENSGLIDEASAKQLGKLLGVTSIVSGTLTELDHSVKLHARLIGTESGEIFGTASTGLEKTSSVRMLLRRGIQESEPEVVEIRPNAGRVHPVDAVPHREAVVVQSVAKESMLVSIQSCRWDAGQLVICATITNQANYDRVLKLCVDWNGNCRVTLPEGLEIKPAYARIGDRRSDGLIENITFFPGEPVKVEMVYHQVPLFDRVLAARFVLRGAFGRGTEFAELLARNVPIEKR